MLFLTTPVIADPPTDHLMDNQDSGRNIAQDEPMWSQNSVGELQSDECVRLMERTFYMPDPANLSRAFAARREMDLARDAFRAGDQYECKRHATLALEDRS